MTNKEKISEVIEHDINSKDYKEIICKIEMGEGMKKKIIYGSGFLSQFV